MKNYRDAIHWKNFKFCSFVYYKVFTMVKYEEEEEEYEEDIPCQISPVFTPDGNKL